MEQFFNCLDSLNEIYLLISILILQGIVNLIVYLYKKNKRWESLEK